MITGASEGIGAACVELFTRHGAEVSICALPNTNSTAAPPKGVLVTWGDITVPQVREQFVQHTLSSLGTIDILVNNAGVGLYGYPSEVSSTLARRMFDVNVFAPLELTQLVIPHMVKRRAGSIVNVGSVGDSVSFPWAVMYCSSKFALKAVNDSLRRELAKHEIHVMRLVPGIVSTDFRKHVLGGSAPNRVENIRRLVTPAQCAEAILRGIQRRSRTVFVPQIGRLFLALESLMPRMMDRYISLKT